MGAKRERKRAVVEEFEGMDLGDPRRVARGRVVAERLAHSVGRSIPLAMLDDAEVEGAYRHLASEEVTLDEIVAPHSELTRSRVRAAGEAYAVHDTTPFLFGGQKRREGLGPVNGKDQGFLAHLSLAVSADGERIPFGLLGVGTRVRKKVGSPSGNERKKWALGIEQSSRGLAKELLIHVADRESDIFELVAQCVAEGRRFIFRAAQDRVVLSQELGEEVTSPLFTLVRSAEALVEVEAQISARQARNRPTKEIRRFPVRRQRSASLAFGAMAVEIRRPAKKSSGLPRSVKINVVRVWEPNPPEGELPVEWVLLTNEAIDTPEAIQRVVEGYRTRWMIEEFNKALKTGCAYEEAQLESVHSLFNLLGYCLVIAYVLLLLRALSRSKRKRPATEVFTPAQLACLRAVSRRRALTKDATADEALLACAGLGGHMKRNGLPGWQTLSRGYARLLEYERGYLLGLAARTCDQS
jgi:hypothetical protein